MMLQRCGTSLLVESLTSTGSLVEGLNIMQASEAEFGKFSGMTRGTICLSGVDNYTNGGAHHHLWRILGQLRTRFICQPDH